MGIVFKELRWLFAGVLIFFTLFTACRNDLDFTPSSGELEFSRDTLVLEDVFSNTSSTTYSFKVYNRQDKNIVIPIVRLERGSGSAFRLNLDGLSGKEFEQVEILAKDSIFVFVETTIDITLQTSESEFLYTDKLLFDTGNNQQDVDLVALVRDAVFLYPDRLEDGSTETIPIGPDENGNEIIVEGFYLQDEELTITNNKPYVIYGFAAVPSNKTLQIQPGARLYFQSNSGLIISSGGKLEAIGDFSEDTEFMEGEIIFRGGRLESSFDQVPEQWSFVLLQAGSINNVLKHVTILNSTIGLWAIGDSTPDQQTVLLENCQIYNSGRVGILADGAHIHASNTVVGNAALSCLLVRAGGHHSYTHCTFGNYWQRSFRNFPTVLITNYIFDENENIISSDLERFEMINSIIAGSNRQEIQLEAEGDSDFNYFFSHNLIQFETNSGELSTNPPYDFNDPNHYLANVFNEAASFWDPSLWLFQIDLESAAIGIADPNAAALIPMDLLGNPRLPTPDSGALQAIEMIEETP